MNLERFKENIKVFYEYKGKKLFVMNDDLVYGIGFDETGEFILKHNKLIMKLRVIIELCFKKIIEFFNVNELLFAQTTFGEIHCLKLNRQKSYPYVRGHQKYFKQELIFYDPELKEIKVVSDYIFVSTESGKEFRICYRNSRVEKVGFNKTIFKPISYHFDFSFELTIMGRKLNSITYKNTKLNNCQITLDLIERNVLFKKIIGRKNQYLLLSTKGDIYNIIVQNIRFDKTDKNKIVEVITNPRIEFHDIGSDFEFLGLSSEGNVYRIYESEAKIIKYLENRKFNNCLNAVNEIFNYECFKEKEITHKRKYYENKFKEANRIGEGSYGEVFKAVNKSDKKSYAIKKLYIDISEKNHNLKEIEILTILKSPYTIGYKKSWLQENEDSIDIKESYSLYIQMELCSTTLDEFTERLIKELNCKQTITESPIGFFIYTEIMKEIIAGVDYLHRNNIIHRDLNPKNILITELKDKRFVKIADFGISCFHETNNEFKSISHTGDVGNDKYMAPELSQWSDRYSGRLVYDNKVDIYSLGIIFGEYIKYDSDLLSRNITNICTSKVIFKTLIEKMKQKLPENRAKCSELMIEMKNFPMKLFDCSYFENIFFENIRELYLNLGIKSLDKIWWLDFFKKYFYDLKNDKYYSKIILKIIFAIYFINKEILSIHPFFDNVLIITKEDFVYFYGKRIIYHNQNNEVTKPTIIPELCQKDIIEFHYGLEVCIARTSDGKLYKCVSMNNYIFEDKGENLQNRPKLIKCLVNQNVTQVSCGLYHTIVLIKDGDIYWWNHNRLNKWIITKINAFNGEKVQSISCGGNLSMVLTVNGNVFVWDNFYYELAKIDVSNRVNLIKKENKITIKKIICGLNHCLMLTTNGDIYSFGSNEYNQLGYKTENKNQLIPQLIETNPRIVFTDICCHFNGDFSAALSTTDYYYVWGKYGDEVIKSPNISEYNSFQQLIGKYVNKSSIKKQNQSIIIQFMLCMLYWLLYCLVSILNDYLY